MHENSGSLPKKHVCSLQRGNVAITWVMPWQVFYEKSKLGKEGFPPWRKGVGWTNSCLGSPVFSSPSSPLKFNPCLSRHFFSESFTLVLNKPWGRKRRDCLEAYSLLAHRTWKFSQVLVPGEGAEELTLVPAGFWAAARLLVAPGAGRNKWLFLCFALHEL